jgi:hypothetical protein
VVAVLSMDQFRVNMLVGWLVGWLAIAIDFSRRSVIEYPNRKLASYALVTSLPSE